MNEPESHHFTTDVAAPTAEGIEAAALEACHAYFGDYAFDWSVSVEVAPVFSGRATYTGRVSAHGAPR